MKNKEKYAKEILDVICNYDVVSVIAMDKTKMEFKPCGAMPCGACYFFQHNYPYNKGTCAQNFVHWANSKYMVKKEFSEADKLYVRVMDKLNWFARDRNGVVYGYVDKPFKNDSVWDVKAGAEEGYELERVSDYTSATFESLSWEDKEPTHRREILGGNDD